MVQNYRHSQFFFIAQMARKQLLDRNHRTMQFSRFIASRFFVQLNELDGAIGRTNKLLKNAVNRDMNFTRH